MKDKEGRIARVETAYVQDNKILALSVNRQDVDRCAKIIRQYGLLTLPVVGSFEDGSSILLSGECEFMALREIGVKSVDAVKVPIIEENEGDKLSLLLSSLKKSPNALSEGILITQLLKAGRHTQSQLGEMLGKSVSWVNKRISLITRLDPAVKELVRMGQLCPHSAQEIARLPEDKQHGFAVKAVRDGLPKSSVEALVAAFNAASCPEEIKGQILETPQDALIRLKDIRTTKAVRLNVAARPATTDIKGSILELRRQMSVFAKLLYDTPTEGMDFKLLKELRSEISALLGILDQRIPFSPGKKEMGVVTYGN